MVFFWPGTAAGPIDYGQRHFNRYRHERPAILMVEMESFLPENPAQEMLCKDNSGSPRYSFGEASPRGPDTFVPLNRFDGTPSNVVEVVFRGAVRLPTTFEYGLDANGPWRRPWGIASN